jgi:hypothetical protein
MRAMPNRMLFNRFSEPIWQRMSDGSEMSLVGHNPKTRMSICCPFDIRQQTLAGTDEAAGAPYKTKSDAMPSELGS